MPHTSGDWIFNPINYSIESTAEWIVHPDEENDEEGIPVQVVSTFGSMGGNDTMADIKLICAAPRMLDLLYHLVREYDWQSGGNLGGLKEEEIEEIKKVIDLATK
jgi:hypothetical protein